MGKIGTEITLCGGGDGFMGEFICRSRWGIGQLGFGGTGGRVSRCMGLERLEFCGVEVVEMVDEAGKKGALVEVGAA